MKYKKFNFLKYNFKMKNKMNKGIFDTQYKILRKSKEFGFYWGIDQENSFELTEWYQEEKDEDDYSIMENLQKLVGGYFQISTKKYKGKIYDVYFNENGRYLFDKNPISDFLDLGFDIYGPIFIKYNSCCDACGFDMALKICGGCKKKRYCNKECQNDDWEFHRNYCK